MIQRIIDWFAVRFGTALRCPKCQGAAREGQGLMQGIYICQPCRYGFSKGDSV